MTASSPEVVAVAVQYRSRDMMRCTVTNIRQIEALKDGDKLIRLADHERLQAETKRLQADHEAARAADKARIAELENSTASALAVAEGGNQSHNMQVIGRILREALDQQGKEGET